MSDRNGIPTFVHLALTSASTEVRRVAQLTAELPDHDRRIKELREAYAQEKADAEKALSARAAEVDAAVKERAGIVDALTEAQENAQGGQDMVRLWCQAKNRPVPEMPDLRDLTMPFQSVPPASGPVQPGPDGSAEGVTVAEIKEGVTYVSRDGWAWTWGGEMTVGDGCAVPLMLTANDQTAAADYLIREFGPLRVAPNVVDFAEPVPAQPWSQEDAWKPWMGQWITVTYADGYTVTGVLEDTSYRRYRLTDVPGYAADEVYVGSLVSVTGVVSAQPAPVSPDPGGAHPAADLSATRPDEPQGSAS